MTRILVVGSGAGGATVARELAGRHDVTVVEAGRAVLAVSADLACWRGPGPPGSSSTSG